MVHFVWSPVKDVISFFYNTFFRAWSLFTIYINGIMDFNLNLKVPILCFSAFPLSFIVSKVGSGWAKI